jgi:hypothetical protein
VTFSDPSLEPDHTASTFQVKFAKSDCAADMGKSKHGAPVTEVHGVGVCSHTSHHMEHEQGTCAPVVETSPRHAAQANGDAPSLSQSQLAGKKEGQKRDHPPTLPTFRTRSRTIGTVSVHSTMKATYYPISHAPVNRMDGWMDD